MILTLVVNSNDLLMSQVVSQETVIRLPIEKGIFTKQEFLKMVKNVDREMKRMVWQAEEEGWKQGAACCSL